MHSRPDANVAFGAPCVQVCVQQSVRFDYCVLGVLESSETRHNFFFFFPGGQRLSPPNHPSTHAVCRMHQQASHNLNRDHTTIYHMLCVGVACIRVVTVDLSQGAGIPWTAFQHMLCDSTGRGPASIHSDTLTCCARAREAETKTHTNTHTNWCR